MSTLVSFPTHFFSLFQELFIAATDFLKLEKVEIGGFRGKIFSEEVHIVNEESSEIWRMLQESKFDPLDYTDAVSIALQIVTAKHDTFSACYKDGIQIGNMWPRGLS